MTRRVSPPRSAVWRSDISRSPLQSPLQSPRSNLRAPISALQSPRSWSRIDQYPFIMRASPGPSARRAEGRSSRSTYHQRVADPEDPKPKKKLTAGSWEEARGLVWAHRKRLGLGLSLMLVNLLAGLVLPTTSKYLMDDVVGKQNWD